MAEARIKPKPKSHASAFTTCLSFMPVKNCLHLSRAKRGKWQCCFVSFLQHKQKMRVTAQPGGTEERALGAAVSSEQSFLAINDVLQPETSSPPLVSCFHLLNCLDHVPTASLQCIWRSYGEVDTWASRADLPLLALLLTSACITTEHLLRVL